MSSSQNLCLISDAQREEYAAEFALLSEMGVEFVYHDEPELALSLIGQLQPNLVLIGTEVEDYEGIEILSMIMSRYREFDRPIVVLPEKEDGMPPMIHHRSATSGQSSVQSSGFEQIAELAKAVSQGPASTPAQPASTVAQPASTPAQPVLPVEETAATSSGDVPMTTAPSAGEQEPVPESSLLDNIGDDINNTLKELTGTESDRDDIGQEEDSFPTEDLHRDFDFKAPQGNLDVPLRDESQAKPNRQKMIAIFASAAVIVLGLVIFFVMSGGEQTPVSTDSADNTTAGMIRKGAPSSQVSDQEPAQNAPQGEMEIAPSPAAPAGEPQAEEPQAQEDDPSAAGEQAAGEENVDDGETFAMGEGGKGEINLPCRFGSGSDVPKITDKEAFGSLLKLLKSDQSSRIVLTGYASGEGEVVDNYGLAMTRAKNVMEILVNRGIDAKRFEIKSLGSNKPVASNETKTGREKNRRVTIQLISN